MKKLFSPLRILFFAAFLFAAETKAQVSLAISSSTNISCNGGNNGTASVIPTGVGPYSFLWTPSGITNDTASGLTAGTYTCVVTDSSDMSTANATVTLTQPNALAATQSQNSVTCNGGSNGTATVVVSGGTPSYTYAWSPTGGTTATATGLAAGTYTCLITDANLCTLSKTVTITQPTALTATISSTPSNCGSPNGTASVIVSGGTPGYTFAWAPAGATSSAITGCVPGSYTCTITDIVGCVITQTVTIGNTPGPTVNIFSQTNVTCFGASNGCATVTVSGGNAPYTYQWVPAGGNAATSCALVAGTYTVVVTDASGCQATRSVMITQPPQLNVSIPTHTNVTCFAGSNGSATGNVSGGIAPYTYNWTPSGGTAGSITNRPAGVYTLTVTDANGCTGTATVVIGQPPVLNVSATASGTCGSCNGQASVTATGGNGPYTYLWLPSNATTQTMSGLCAGSYTVTVTDANTCTATATATVANTPAATIAAGPDDSICPGGSVQFNAIPSGTAPFNYNWSNPGSSLNSTSIVNPTASPAVSSNYTVTLTDANGCQSNDIIIVHVLPAMSLSFSSTNATCSQSDGSATVTPAGGFAPYSYAWSNSGTSATITNIPSATYSVTVSANHPGCSANGSTIVNNSNGPTVSFSGVTNVTCFAGGNGAATANPTGGTAPYTYLWQPGTQTTQTATGLTAGSYTVTVVDATACSSIQTVSITEPTQLLANLSSLNTTCFSACDGSATVIASGGVAPYTYLWLPGAQTTASISALCPGTYTVTVTDNNGCATTQQVSITQAPQLSINPTSTPAINSQCNGTANVAISGGIAPYTINWLPGNFTTASLTNLCAGVYTVTVTDANGCSAQNNVTINSSSQLFLGMQVINMPNCATGGKARAWAIGGVPPYTFLWSNSSTNDTLFNAPSGIHSCVVTDAVGTATGGIVSLYNTTHGVIRGKVYKDLNSNCVFDSGDQAIAGQYIFSTQGGGYTNSTGDYSINCYSAGTVTVSVGSNVYTMYTTPLCPVTGAQSVTLPTTCDTASGVDFARAETPGIQDLRVILGMPLPPRAGFPNTLTISYYNVGTIAVSNATVNLVFDSILSFISTTLAPSINQQAYMEWNLGTLQPGQSGGITVVLQVPTIQNGGYIGRPMFYSATINPVAGDYTPVNNADDEHRFIVSSWDPNDKVAYTPEMDSVGNITPNDTLISYTIHFQNTGNDTAYNVYVEDTLSSYLDPGTIILGASSAPYTMELLNGNLLRFNFYNIMLPDSNHNLLASNGFVKFKIKRMPNLPVGTVITNTANIYFDFNPAVVTNTTSNMIWINVPAGIVTIATENITAYPNPFDESTNIVLPASASGKQNELVLTDIEGRVVRTMTIRGTNTFTLQRGDLESGIYFCTVRSDGQTIGNAKLIVK